MDCKPSRKINPYPGRLIIICDKKSRILYEQTALPAKVMATRTDEDKKDKRDTKGTKT